MIKIKLITGSNITNKIGDVYIAAVMVCTHGIASREGGDRPSTCSITYHFKLESRLISVHLCTHVIAHVCWGYGG